jgi:hypothetical protein
MEEMHEMNVGRGGFQIRISNKLLSIFYSL